MATLDSTNVVNGNTIEATDVLQLYQAFGSAGAGITGLAMTGSLYGNALTATTATTATTASNINTATVSTGTYYLTFVTGSGVKAPKIASLLEYNAATNELNVTASYADTASYALSAAPSSPIYSDTIIDNSSNPPSNPYPITSAGADIIFADTSNPVGLTFGIGTIGQVIKLTTEKSQASLNSNNISITGSAGLPVYGLGGNSIIFPTPDILSNILPGGAPTIYSVEFYFDGTGWTMML